MNFGRMGASFSKMGAPSKAGVGEPPPTLETPLLDLDAASDSGTSDSDNITNASPLGFTADFPSGLLEDDEIEIYLDGVLDTTHVVTAGEAGGTDIDLTGDITLPEGATSIRLKHVRPPDDFSAQSAALTVTRITDNPTLSSSDPVDGSSTATTTQNITLTFNRDVVFGTGDITLCLTSDDSTVEAFDVVADVGTGAGKVSVSGSVVTLNPASNMDDGEGYYILVDATAIDDLAGNSFAGIAVKTTLNWTVVDTNAPTISTLNPADNATGISAGANLVATFDESVSFDSTVSIGIYETVGDGLVEAFDEGDIGTLISISGAVLTINPTADLDNETGYYVLIDASSIKDASGNFFAGLTAGQWSFETGAAVTEQDFAVVGAYINSQNTNSYAYRGGYFVEAPN